MLSLNTKILCATKLWSCFERYRYTKRNTFLQCKFQELILTRLNEYIFFSNSLTKYNLLFSKSGYVVTLNLVFETSFFYLPNIITVTSLTEINFLFLLLNFRAFGTIATLAGVCTSSYSIYEWNWNQKSQFTTFQPLNQNVLDKFSDLIKFGLKFHPMSLEGN